MMSDKVFLQLQSNVYKYHTGKALYSHSMILIVMCMVIICKVPTNVIIKHDRNLNDELFELQNMQLYIKKSQTHCFNKGDHAITSLIQ